MPAITDDWGGVAVADETARDDWGGIEVAPETDDWGGIAVANETIPAPVSGDHLSPQLPAAGGGDRPAGVAGAAVLPVGPVSEQPAPIGRPRTRITQEQIDQNFREVQARAQPVAPRGPFKPMSVVIGADGQPESLPVAEGPYDFLGEGSGPAVAALGAGIDTAPAALRQLFDYTGYAFFRNVDPVLGTNYANELYLPRLQATGGKIAENMQFAKDVGGTFGEVIATLGQQVGMLPAQLLTAGGASAASATAQAATRSAIAASATFGGLQSASQSFSQNVTERVRLGEKPEEAASAEFLPSVSSGLITAATTQAFGASGIESVFRQVGAKGAVQKLVGALKQGGFEVAEEISDEAGQIVNDLVNGKQVTAEDAVRRVGTAAVIASIMGTGVSGLHAAMDSAKVETPRQRLATELRESGAPLTAEAVEASPEATAPVAPTPPATTPAAPPRQESPPPEPDQANRIASAEVAPVAAKEQAPVRDATKPEQMAEKSVATPETAAYSPEEIQRHAREQGYLQPAPDASSGATPERPAQPQGSAKVRSVEEERARESALVSAYDLAEKLGQQVARGQPDTVIEAAVMAAYDNGRRSVESGGKFNPAFMRKSAMRAAGDAAKKQGTSLDKPFAEGFEETPKDRLESEAPSPAEQAGTADAASVAERLLNGLPDRERHIIHEHTMEGRTLEDIGKELGLSRERVRQIHEKALATLRVRMAETEAGVAKPLSAQQPTATPASQSTRPVSPAVEQTIPQATPAAGAEATYAGGPGAMGPVEAMEMQAARAPATSTKNAVMEAERAARNADPIIKEARQSNAATLDKAEAQIEANPNHARALVAGLKDGTKREVSEVDEAVLLYEKVRLRNERTAEAERASDPNATPEERLVAKQKWEELEAQINDVDIATEASGRIWGRLGQFRQRLLADDFTFEAMERRARVKKGDVLTPAESAKIKEQADQIADLQKKLAELEARRDTGNATEAAEETVRKLRAKVGGKKTDTTKEQAATVESLRKRIADGSAIKDLGSYIQRLAEQFVRSGIKERDPLIDAVHGVIEPMVPGITRRETMDLISGYGDFKPLTTDAVKVQLRDLKGQMQQVGKIEDMQAKKAPAKTGVERRTPSDEERRLIKEVNELKKKGGFSVTDPATQLKSALDAIKTRLKNQIKDITTQIDTGEKPVAREGVPYDDAALRLKELRDRVRQTLEDIEGKPEMSDAQRLKIANNALDKAIAETERQIKTGDLYPERVIKKAPTSAELEAKRAQLEALKAERDLLRTLDDSMVEVNKEISLLNAIARVEKGLPEQKASTPTVDTARVSELKERLAAVKSARDSSPEAQARRIEAASESVIKSIASLDARLRAGDTSPQSKGGTRPDSPELEALRAERDAMQALMQELRNAEKPKLSPDEIALKAFKARTAARILELNDRMARGDFAAKPKRELVPDKEAIDLKFRIEKVKEEYNRARFEDQLRNRSLGKKILGGASEVLNTARALITSIDFSAVLRQANFIVLGHPIRAARALPDMFKAFASEKAQFRVMDEINSRPNASLYKKAKLYLADSGALSLTRLEEQFMSRWANKIPLVAGSQRAYAVFLNKLRADSFDALTASLSKTGRATPDEAAAIANFINVATGRGNIGFAQQAAAGLNTVFFSPRYVASRFNLMFGQPLYGGSGRTRALVAKEYGRYLAGVAVVYALAAAAKDDEDKTPLVEVDPRASSFGKIRFGNTYVDPLAGLLQNTVLLSRVATGEKKTNKGKIEPIRGEKVPYKGDTTYDVIADFTRTKFSPAFGSAINVVTGKNVIGQKTTLASEAIGMVTPMSLRSVYDVMIDQGVPRGMVLDVLSLFGLGVNSYETGKK